MRRTKARGGQRDSTLRVYFPRFRENLVHAGCVSRHTRGTIVLFKKDRKCSRVAKDLTPPADSTRVNVARRVSSAMTLMNSPRHRCVSKPAAGRKVAQNVSIEHTARRVSLFPERGERRSGYEKIQRYFAIGA